MAINWDKPLITRSGKPASLVEIREGLHVVEVNGKCWGYHKIDSGRWYANPILTDDRDLFNVESHPSTQETMEEPQSVRESIGTKINTHLVPYEAIAAMAVSLEYGATKYDPTNYTKGQKESTLLASIDRHTRAIMRAEEIDEDSDLPHYCMLAGSVAMYATLASRGTLIKDLPGPGKDARSVSHISREAQQKLRDVLDRNQVKT